MKEFLVGVSIIIVLMMAVFGIAKISNTPLFGANAIQQIGGGGGAQPSNPLSVASTTPCAIAGSSSTSSLQHFSLNITTSTSSAGTLVVGTSTSAYATSTSPFATIVVAANSQYLYTWNGGVNNDQIYPNTFVTAGMTNGSTVSYGYTYGGTCSAVIISD